jgi:hypothetical protein
MWRALFIALGFSAVVLGLECLVVEKAVLAKPQPAPGAPVKAAAARRDFIPPEWAPWSLMSVGAVTMLYSVTIPKRGA